MTAPTTAPDPAAHDAAHRFQHTPARKSALPPTSLQSHRRLRTQLLNPENNPLTDAELLQLLLGRSRHLTSAAADAARLLHLFGTLPRILAARPDRLRALASLPDDAIAAIKTTEALAIRHAQAGLPTKIGPTLPTYDAVVDYCRTLIGHRETEAFFLIFLDGRHTLIAAEKHQQGTVNHTPVYIREVCVRALELHATSVIAIHNHPSRNPEPSHNDIDMTRQLKTALKTIGITLLDHIIVTSEDSISFHTRGLL